MAHYGVGCGTKGFGFTINFNPLQDIDPSLRVSADDLIVCVSEIERLAAYPVETGETVKPMLYASEFPS